MMMWRTYHPKQDKVEDIMLRLGPTYMAILKQRRIQRCKKDVCTSKPKASHNFRRDGKSPRRIGQNGNMASCYDDNRRKNRCSIWQRRKQDTIFEADKGEKSWMAKPKQCHRRKCVDSCCKSENKANGQQWSTIQKGLTKDTTNQGCRGKKGPSSMLWELPKAAAAKAWNYNCSTIKVPKTQDKYGKNIEEARLQTTKNWLLRYVPTSQEEHIFYGHKYYCHEE